MTYSLRLRLLLAALVFVGLGLTITGLAIQTLFANYVASRYVKDMEAVIDTVVAGVHHADAGWSVTANPPDPRFDLPAGGRYWQLTSGQLQPLRSRSLWDLTVDLNGVLPVDRGLYRSDGPGGAPIEFIIRDISIETGALPLKLRALAGFDAGERDAAIAEFRAGLVGSLMIGGGVLMLASMLQILVGLRPLDGLRGSVAAVRQGRDKRLTPHVPVEVLPLVEEINALLAAQEGAIERARARAADLAHAIKTPLTVINQAAELLADQEHGNLILDQVEAIRQRTDRQLQQARLAVGQFASSDLKAACEKLVRVIATLPKGDKITWTVNIADDLLLSADAADLAEAIGNVLDNARKWATGSVIVTAQVNHGQVAITIDDDGPGIAQADRDAALARGLLRPRAGSENGLGLTISREIVEAYGGSIELDHAPGGGLRVVLMWPLATRLPQRAPGKTA